MVLTESEMMSQGEVESPSPSQSEQQQQQQQQHKNHGFSSLGRQSSIYSLTLDEFQNTLCESGKNFGSMNMDEFLNSIWTAEENQAHAHVQVHNSHHPHANATSTSPMVVTPNNSSTTPQLSLDESNNNNNTSSTDPKGIASQSSLPRQGSLTVPPPLSRKTVDEVWAEIHRTQQEHDQQRSHGNNVQNPGSTPQQQQQRQVTFGEMTLEDFLVRAGVVREQSHQAALPQQQPQQPSYGGGGGFFQSNHHPVVLGSGFVQRPVMSLGGGGGGVASAVNVSAYQGMAQSGGGIGEVSGYAGAGSHKRGGGANYSSQTATAAATSCYGGRIGNESGSGYGGQMQQGLGVVVTASPVSPVSPDGLCGNQVDGGVGQYGMEIGGIRSSSAGGRKRIVDGPIEKVVERRQRRMIKNRESAARSRARKQAYTVELEAELNQLKEENAHLKLALAEMERKIRQQQVTN